MESNISIVARLPLFSNESQMSGVWSFPGNTRSSALASRRHRMLAKGPSNCSLNSRSQGTILTIEKAILPFEERRIKASTIVHAPFIPGFITTRVETQASTMGYSERVCQICGISFNIGRTRTKGKKHQSYDALKSH